jgi:hypothetical protein
MLILSGYAAQPYSQTLPMYDMQQGNRKGIWTDLMKPVVSRPTTT